MSDEKLDLILNVVSDIKNRQTSLEKTVGEMNTRQTSLEKTVGEMNLKIDNLSGRVDNLSSEFSDFRKQVADSFAIVQNRFTLLEKQMVAIGVEIKAEIKREIEAVAARIDRLEKQIIYDRSETLENKDEIREINKRLAQIENNIGI